MDILKGLFKEFGWFFNILIGLGILWFFAGGYMSETARKGPYLKPPAPLDSGEAYGGKVLDTSIAPKQTLNLPEAPGIVIRDLDKVIQDFIEQSKEALEIRDGSVSGKAAYIDGVGGAEARDAQKEWLRVIASPSLKGAVNVSGLTLAGGGYGVSARLPQAANLPVLGAAYRQADVSMPANGVAVVSSGKSPIGTSFRVNICSGYLGQFQTYVPALPQECPVPSAELDAYGLGGDASCKAFVQKLPRCRAYSGSFPSDISPACRAFVAGELSYNSCVARHQKDPGFYANEWRLFLEQKDELWKQKREIIRLFDRTGTAIDAITY